MEFATYSYQPGITPLLISCPHAGTDLPASLAAGLSDAARSLPDTDWQVDQLYQFATRLGAGLLVAGNSRYLVDLNRPADDQPLYQTATTGLFPAETFDGDPVWQEGLAPDDGTRATILEQCWKPYHEQLEHSLTVLKQQHGHAVLLEAHSIRSEVPRLFDGRLPDFNLGSNAGASADEALSLAAWEVLSNAQGYSAVRDARFRGGHITRHFGQPQNGWHALQLELSQAAYLEREGQPGIDVQAQARLEPVLQRLVTALIEYRPDAG